MQKPVRFYGRSRINEGASSLGASMARFFAVLTVGLGPVFLYDPLSRLVTDFPGWALSLPLLVLVAAALVPTRIRVDDDGVLVSWLGSRFCAYGEILNVTPSSKDVILARASGGIMRLPVGRKRRGPTDGPRRDELVRAIGERLEQFNLTRDIQERVARKERDGRSWATHLRALTGGSPFRTMGQNPDALWHLLENPVASTDARVGAAVALRMSSPDPDTRQRIGAIAKSSASPRVRVSLEAVLSWSGDDDALTDVLDRVPRFGTEGKRARR